MCIITLVLMNFVQVISFVSLFDDSYTRKDILSMEEKILRMLEWYLTVPTRFHFLVRFIKAVVGPADDILSWDDAF